MNKTLSTLLLFNAAIALGGCAASARPAAAAAGNANASGRSDVHLSIPTRISRDFFAETVSGRIAIASGQDTEPFAELQSDIRWRDEPTELPPPRPGYLADFRDHPGCADYVSLDGVSYCFTVAPDVSSLDVSAAKTRTEGLGELVTAELKRQRSYGCEKPVRDLAFDSATRDDTSKLTVLYRGTVGCPGEAPTPVSVTLEFQRL
jgi:hypothetical protein